MTRISSVQAALRRHFTAPTDAKGYVQTVDQNLVPGVRLEQFEADLRRGSGNELDRKFLAVHSSAALAVNCFAPFKARERRRDFQIFGLHALNDVQFEKKLRIFPNRTPANLDVYLDFGASAIAVESKLLEYFQPKVAKFAPAYERLAPPTSEPSWWAQYLEAKDGPPRHLDRAQLLKHYFGLRRLQESGNATDLTLLYLFWEPLNWQDVPECQRHRQEVQEFALRVVDSSIPFRWMTYSELWNEWSSIDALRDHANRLKARYEIRV